VVSTDGVWSPERRRLTIGLAMTVTLVASESLSVATVLPVVSRELGDVALYGWVFSAFFLGSLVGTVVAGGQADRRGLGWPFAVGLCLFAAGLASGGLAPNMGVLVASRAVQGFGAGVIPAAAYVGIGRGYPADQRARMFAILSTAWVVPGLVGPAIAGLIADNASWRWVFLGLIPLVGVAAALTLPAVRDIPRSSAPEGDRVDGLDAVRVAAGAGCLLAGLTLSAPVAALALIVLGAAVGLPALRRLLPPGTRRAAPGLPSAILCRGLLTFAFFGADAYVPFTLTTIRGASAVVAGLNLTASTMAWTAGAWIQERQLGILGGPRRIIAVGLGSVMVGIAAMTALLSRSVPLAFGPLAWAIAGLGIGMAYAPISLVVLQEAAPGQEGRATASMQLCDLLGTALGTGVGGAAVAVGRRSGWDPRAGVAVAFALAVTSGATGIAIARRLPAKLNH
jgi:MFS family permease